MCSLAGRPHSLGTHSRVLGSTASMRSSSISMARKYVLAHLGLESQYLFVADVPECEQNLGLPRSISVG